MVRDMSLMERPLSCSFPKACSKGKVIQRTTNFNAVLVSQASFSLVDEFSNKILFSLYHGCKTT